MWSERDSYSTSLDESTHSYPVTQWPPSRPRLSPTAFHEVVVPIKTASPDFFPQAPKPFLKPFETEK